MNKCKVNFTYVDNKKLLDEMAEELAKESLLAIDLECENGLHHYGSYISLIQISTESKKNFIVDVIKLKTLGKLKNILEDKKIQKIFHDISFDLRILRHEFDCRPKNIFDSELAAVFAGKENVGLGSLLEEYFSFDKKKKFQMADWTKRPLSEQMLCYAIQDTVYLITLIKNLISELKNLNRYEWFLEELSYLETKDLIHKEPIFSDIKGFGKLSDLQKSIAKEVFNLRESLAKENDVPTHYIMNNRRLIELTKFPPITVFGWKKLSGVHPAVKRNANKFFEAVNYAKNNVQPSKRLKTKRYNQEQRNHFAKLNLLREKLSKQTGLKPFLILNKDQIQDIVVTNELNSLRSWQKKLVEKELNQNK